MPSSDENKYALTSWTNSLYNDLEVPTGQMCQVRKPGINVLIEAGVLDSADTLTALVNEKHIKRVKGKATPQVDTTSLMEDPTQIMKVIELVDRIVEYIVVTPDVKRPIELMPKEDKPEEFTERPLRDQERDGNTVYTDSVDMADRMFIFQYAIGGSTNLERFRKQYEEDMGSL